MYTLIDELLWTPGLQPEARDAFALAGLTRRSRACRAVVDASDQGVVAEALDPRTPIAAPVGAWVDAVEGSMWGSLVGARGRLRPEALQSAALLPVMRHEMPTISLAARHDSPQAVREEALRRGVRQPYVGEVTFDLLLGAARSPELLPELAGEARRFGPAPLAGALAQLGADLRCGREPQMLPFPAGVVEYYRAYPNAAVGPLSVMQQTPWLSDAELTAVQLRVLLELHGRLRGISAMRSQETFALQGILVSGAGETELRQALAAGVGAAGVLEAFGVPRHASAGALSLMLDVACEVGDEHAVASVLTHPNFDHSGVRGRTGVPRDVRAEVDVLARHGAMGAFWRTDARRGPGRWPHAYYRVAAQHLVGTLDGQRAAALAGLAQGFEGTYRQWWDAAEAVSA